MYFWREYGIIITDKSIISPILSNVTHGCGYVYSLQYHIVFVAKYRKPIFIGERSFEKVEEYIKSQKTK